MQRYMTWIPFVLFILYLIFWCGDNYFLSVKKASVVVEKKTHASAQNYSTNTYNTIYNPTTGTYSSAIPETQGGVIPEAFILEMRIDGRLTGASVSKEMFDSVNVGDTVSAEYTQKRFTGSVLVIDVKKS